MFALPSTWSMSILEQFLYSWPVAGMSVAYPLFWIPSRWGFRSSTGGISARTAYAIGAVMWPCVLAFLLLALDPSVVDQHVQHLSIDMLNVAPVLAGPVLWLLLKVLHSKEPESSAATKQGRAAGVQAVQQLCYVYAGVCASMHATALLQFCSAGAPLQALLDAMIRVVRRIQLADPCCGPCMCSPGSPSSRSVGRSPVVTADLTLMMMRIDHDSNCICTSPVAGPFGLWTLLFMGGLCRHSFDDSAARGG